MKALHYIPATVLATFLVMGGLFIPAALQAQSAENECTPPNFQISSNTQLYALAGESFSYYVVTADSTEYQLSSNLPNGLIFTDGQIQGTPTVTGDYTVEFTAMNDCGTTNQSISLSVIESTPVNNGITQSDQSAAASESVGLDEIPETGIVADTLLTVGFYLLALLFLAGWLTRRFTASPVTGNDAGSNSYESYYTQADNSSPSTESSNRRRFGDGIRR